MKSIAKPLNDQSEYLNAYPNPATEKLTVDFHALKDSRIKIKLTDILGNVALLDNDFTKQSSFIKEYNMTPISKGIYFLSVEGEGMKSKVIRVIVE